VPFTICEKSNVAAQFPFGNDKAGVVSDYYQRVNERENREALATAKDFSKFWVALDERHFFIFP
jgi:hypothetical protein